jgi:hypothetical protein
MVSCEKISNKSFVSKEFIQKKIFSQPSFKKDLEKFIKISP